MDFKSQKGRIIMGRIEELVSATKLHDVLHKKEENKARNTVLWVLAIVGAVAAVAGIAYAVYRYFAPDYLDDYEDDFEDDFPDDFLEEDEEA